MIAVVVVVAAGSLTVAYAQQRIWSGFYGYTPPKFTTASTYDGSFNFCRAMFSSNRREKQGWSTDYPGADINFSVRLAELTKVPVKMTTEGKEQVPDAVVVGHGQLVVPLFVHADGGRRHGAVQRRRSEATA